MNEKIAKNLNESPIIAHFSFTGGATSFIGEYLKFGGASKTLVGAVIPYHFSELDSFLDQKPNYGYCSKETARQMAVKSYSKAEESKIKNEDSFIMGVGVTCSLTTGKSERAGRENKAFVCIHTKEKTYDFKLDFINYRDREFQEKEAANFIFYCLKRVLKDNEVEFNQVYLGNNEFSYYFSDPKFNVTEAVAKKNTITPDKVLKKDSKTLYVISGTFNPFHDGHKDIFDKCLEIIEEEDAEILIEVSSNSFGKGEVDHASISERILSAKEKTGHDKVAHFNKPLFTEKFDFYTGVIGYQRIVFVVGIDTYERLESHHGYDNLDKGDGFVKEGGKAAHFLVFPRDGKKIDYSSKRIHHKSYEIELTQNHNISSTEIRNKR